MDRKPILLSKNSCAIILLFTRHDELFDVMSGVYNNMNDREASKLAAQEFISQLEGRWNIVFMKELKKQIDIKIKENKKRIDKL